MPFWTWPLKSKSAKSSLSSNAGLKDYHQSATVSIRQSPQIRWNICWNYDNLSIILQEHGRCDRKGWDCVERNFDNNFTCSVSCEGIYADIQLALLGDEEKKADEEKVKEVVDQYEKFKRRTLPNFRFNPQKGATHYGRKWFINIAFIFSAKCWYLGEDLNASSLHLVQIYFDTATFDEIERDEKVKFSLLTRLLSWLVPGIICNI